MLADQLAIQLEHKIQLGDKVGMLTQAVHQIVVAAAGGMHIPERTAGQRLDGVPVGGGFMTDQ